MYPMFYFLLALTAVLAATANAGDAVLDTDGDIIFNGSYYVCPGQLNVFTGGGLTILPGINRDKLCPFFIAQVSATANKGIPVKFSNWKSKLGFLPTSENLNINMDVKDPICNESTYWWVAPSDKDKTQFIAAGPKPEFGEDSSKKLFQIKKAGDLVSYKIAFCPDGKDCTDVGIFVDRDGVQRLALGAFPFSVVFMKATGTSSKTVSIV